MIGNGIFLKKNMEYRYTSQIKFPRIWEVSLIYLIGGVHVKKLAMYAVVLFVVISLNGFGSFRAEAQMLRVANFSGESMCVKAKCYSSGQWSNSARLPNHGGYASIGCDTPDTAWGSFALVYYTPLNECSGCGSWNCDKWKYQKDIMATLDKAHCHGYKYIDAVINANGNITYTCVGKE